MVTKLVTWNRNFFKTYPCCDQNTPLANVAAFKDVSREVSLLWRQKLCSWNYVCEQYLCIWLSHLPRIIVKLSAFMRSNGTNGLSVNSADTHRWIRITSPRQRRSLGVSASARDMASESLESTTVLWQEPVQTRDQSRQRTDVLKKEKHFAHWGGDFCPAAVVVGGAHAPSGCLNAHTFLL